ncbi:MAG: type I DNA topoisomerase [Dehalococcoidales bacterium]|nr:type I DNA topoisomerase [Dehalococcoidales bacterium]
MTKKNNLVIVESPAKARTLARILGSDYTLKASLGHVRDLPKSQLGVDIENSFMPKYVVPRVKSKIARELKEAARDASTIYLATDPDREGEAISWHLATVMKTNKTPFRRVVFHEITEEAVKQAFQHPRAVDMHLVNAQQARRVLDRLVGYKISPLLWRKVRRGLSAGRVQSVTLKIIVDREREIEKFIPIEYWSIEAELTRKTAKADEPAFRALLIGLTGGGKLEIHSQAEAVSIKDDLEKASYSVIKVQTKKITRQPAAPFITSTLQQEAWRRFRFSAGQTMAIAQQLYEGLPLGKEGSVGLITYMRTDSTRVARSAVVEAREFIDKKYGAEYVPPHARSFTRVVKGAQEAHEAIRPTQIRREPSSIKNHLNANQFRLYELIWKRMVASQMAAAILDSTTVDIEAASPATGTDYLLRTSSSIIRFPGFTTLYSEGKDQPENEKQTILPRLEKDDQLRLLGLSPEQHFTQPPPHYTEATLIRTLEQYGIGRPSTYAPILSTIQDREYVSKTGGSLRPTELGIVVNDLVSQYFPDIVDTKFTALMEDELDEIASEKREWVGVVRNFYTPFEENLDKATRLMERVKLADEETDETCPEGHPMVIKMGRFGKFLACSLYPEHKYTRSFQIKTGAKCPECGSDIVEKKNKKKRTFYGCSNYPECTFATNYKPLPQPCPKCGSLLTEYRGKQVKCVKCDYKGKLDKD